MKRAVTMMTSASEITVARVSPSARARTGAGESAGAGAGTGAGAGAIAVPRPGPVPLPHTGGGFSLIELLCALALVAVLAMLAAPALAGMVRNYRLTAAAGDLYGAIDLTRTQAIARSRRVLLVPLEPTGRNWQQGWVVFVDKDRDRRPTPGDEIVASHGPLDDGIVITARLSTNPMPNYLAFNASGRSCSDTSSMAARWGTISLHHHDQIRRIKINMLGRARICRPDIEGATCDGGEPD